MIELPAWCRTMFVSAGWYPGRSCIVEADVPREHPAYAVLQSFSGLTVGSTGRGVECAQNDVLFKYEPLEEKPITPGCKWDGDCEIQCWEQLLGTSLIRVGFVHHGHGELYVAEDGRCFGNSQVHDAFYFEGQDFQSAMSTLLQGYRSRPLLNPTQSEVNLYGETYVRGDARIYTYEN